MNELQKQAFQALVIIFEAKKFYFHEELAKTAIKVAEKYPEWFEVIDADIIDWVRTTPHVVKDIKVKSALTNLLQNGN